MGLYFKITFFYCRAYCPLVLYLVEPTCLGFVYVFLIVFWFVLGGRKHENLV